MKWESIPRPEAEAGKGTQGRGEWDDETSRGDGVGGGRFLSAERKEVKPSQGPLLSDKKAKSPNSDAELRCSTQRTTQVREIQEEARQVHNRINEQRASDPLLWEGVLTVKGHKGTFWLRCERSGSRWGVDYTGCYGLARLVEKHP